ncbi:hypothetical protein QAD02_012368 [Eretmocerus hayati]|uniref:Uncharacterized protein n=1 Tax=Eretmocerus hayati TaxID=131215 RepID=A0ACC2NZI4_9HYME|nr:hypothetical protein QAD02_012368 [Eretmocerus hayati]
MEEWRSAVPKNGSRRKLNFPKEGGFCFLSNTSSGSGVGTRKCFCLATTTVTAVVAIAIGNLLVKEVSAHGRLIEPPSRASMWRYGFDTPHDYNDHESYCGGFTRQWQRNGGKCGICGDAWDTKTPRAHETGGKYGTGVIVRRYRTGATIPIKVELTANHRGYFEFRTCGMKYRNQEVNQECLDENLLTGDNGTARYYPGEGNRIFEAEYKLPDGLTCAWCVFQWRYIAGNNWGQCPDGTGAVGCGPQEEFRACADIAIGDDQPNSTESSDYSPGQGEPLWLYNFVIAGTCLLVVLAVMALVYTYYYHAERAKQWLMARRLLNPERHSHQQQFQHQQPPPIAPPRHKKHLNQMLI